jgi:hypothetical protein
VKAENSGVEPGPGSESLSRNADSPRTGFSIGRRFLDAGIALLAFVLVCAGLNALLPFPEIDVVSADLRFFKEHQDEFNTVFVGSSHIHHQISPAIFDRITSETGHPTRTFNFGINGMFPPESGYVLERLLSTKPRHLKWVFIELDELEIRRFPKAEASRRSLYWHDWKRTSLVLQKIVDTARPGDGLSLPGEIGEVLAPGPGKSDARDLFIFHSALFAKNFTNIGRKIDLAWWSSHLGKQDVPPKGLGRDGDGFLPQSKTMSAEETIAYETGLKDAVANAESRFVSAATEQAYRQWAEDVRRIGATPIFLVTPKTTQIKLGFRPESGVTDTVMLFNDARAYPQLYRNEMRVDADHLNGAAAEEFTELVARKFSQLIQEKQIQ